MYIKQVTTELSLERKYVLIILSICTAKCIMWGVTNRALIKLLPGVGQKSLFSQTLCITEFGVSQASLARVWSLQISCREAHLGYTASYIIYGFGVDMQVGVGHQFLVLVIITVSLFCQLYLNKHISAPS